MAHSKLVETEPSQMKHPSGLIDWVHTVFCAVVPRYFSFSGSEEKRFSDNLNKNVFVILHTAEQDRGLALRINIMTRVFTYLVHCFYVVTFRPSIFL